MDRAGSRRAGLRSGGPAPAPGFLCRDFACPGRVVVAASLITRNFIRDQEWLILRERTGEAAAVLGSAFSGSRASLRLLGAAGPFRSGRAKLFAEAARSVTTASTQIWLETAQRGSARQTQDEKGSV